MSNPETPRYLEKFTDVGGSTSYTFPFKQYQLDSTQALKLSIQNIIGADYPVDLLGFQPAPKDAGKGLHRAYIVGNPGSGGDDIDDALDEMRHKLSSIGLGKLYMVDSATAERWAYARLAAMPTTQWKVGDVDFITYVLDWTILSDWYETTGYSDDFPIVSDPQTITVPNAGTSPVFGAIIIIKDTFTNPTLTNTTNGYEIDSTQDGAAVDDWLKIDAGQGIVVFSSDGGVSYFGAFDTVTLPTQQIQLMKFDPGNNSVDVTGCNGATIHIEFDIPSE